MNLTDGTTTVPVDDVTATRLDRDLGTTTIAAASGWIVAQQPTYVGTMALTGTLEVLVPDLAAALAVDALIRAATVTLDAAGHPLDALQFRAVDRLRIVAERTVPGRAARWTVTVPFVEVP